MLRRARGVLEKLGLYGLWSILSTFAALAVYQAYVTLLYVGILAVQTPATRPPGWSTKTISGLSRFLVLVLGAIWLFLVSWGEGYLREGQEEGRLRARVARAVVFIATLYGTSAGVLLLLSK